MQILSVSPRVITPLTSGSRIRIFNLLSRLSERHEILQFSQTRTRDLRQPDFRADVSHTPGYREHRYRSVIGSALCESMERKGFGAPILCGYPLSVSRPGRLRKWMEWADLAMVEFPWQYAHCRSIAGGKPVILASHNVQAAKVRSGGDGGITARIWAQWTEALERRAVLDADLVLAVSEEDRAEFVRRYGANASKIVVAPNGADTTLYRPVDGPARAALRQSLNLPPGPMAIFPAPHNQTPIVEGLKWVRRVAALLPEVTFLVTGAVEGGPKVEGNLHFTGFVSKYESYLGSADCFLCPIALGGGTKLKLIEAAAAGLPIAAFAESIRGTTFQADEHLLVAEHDAGALAAAVRRLLNEPGMAEQLGQAAHVHAARHYDWAVIARTLGNALAALPRQK